MPNTSRIARDFAESPILPRTPAGLGFTPATEEADEEGNLLFAQAQGHPDLAAPSIPSSQLQSQSQSQSELNPFSPSPSLSYSDCELGPLSAAVSAGTLSPLEDFNLTLTERRARRRQAVDFHSHAQFVEVFHLSEADVAPDYVFALDDGLGHDANNGAGGGACGCVNSELDAREPTGGESGPVGDGDAYDVDARDLTLTVRDTTSPTVSLLLQIVSDDFSDEDEDEDEDEDVEDERVAQEGFPWEAEESEDDDNQELDHDHFIVDQPNTPNTQPGGIDENGNPVRSDFCFPIPPSFVSQLSLWWIFVS